MNADVPADVNNYRHLRIAEFSDTVSALPPEELQVCPSPLFVFLTSFMSSMMLNYLLSWYDSMSMLSLNIAVYINIIIKTGEDSSGRAGCLVPAPAGARTE